MTAPITVAMKSALSGMQVNQTALGVTANNIANANTESYTRKIAALQTVLIDGQGGGVRVASVTREVSEFLIRDLREQMSARGMAMILDRYLGNTQDMFGPPESSASIAARLTDLGNSFQTLAVEPESPNGQQNAVNELLAVARQLNHMSGGVQDLRMEANREIDQLVKRANALIGYINELNTDIARNFHLNRPKGDLEDRRDEALAELSGIMNISHFTRDDGQTVVFAANGRTLVDTTGAALEYTMASSMSASITYPGGLSGIRLGDSDLTTELTSGKLKALVDLRDTILPGLGDQMDTLAGVLRDRLNAIHNDSAAFPPPHSLTGTRSFATPSTDTADLTGTVRIAVVNQAGMAVHPPMQFSLDDLQTVVGGPPTITQLRDAINGAYAASTPAIPGLAGASASLDASGRLILSATDSSHGLAISEGDSREASTGFGFSHFFGLNDLLVGTETGGLSRSLAIRSDIVASPHLLARGSLAPEPLPSGSAALTIGDNTAANRMFNAFQESFTFPAAGALPGSVQSLSSYAASIAAENAHQARAAKSDLQFREVIFQDIKAKSDSVSGVNLDEELGNLILFQNAYAANARMLTTLSEIMKILSDLV